jgi:hypothetical protein
MERAVFHVTSNDDGKWKVEREGAGGAGNVFEDKEEAVRQAKSLAQGAQLGQVIVHGRDGRIQYENTYGADPRNIRG